MTTQHDYDFPTDQSLEHIARAIEGLATRDTLAYDSTTGRYDNASLRSWLAAQADGNAYGVSIPKSAATGCTKTGANSGIAAPVPGIVGRPAADPYVGRGAFRFYEVNGGVSVDGTPYVTAIRGDGRFSRKSADVWIMTPVLYWSHSETDSTVELSVSDTKLTGMAVQPQGALPSGERRPYMLYAKYPLVNGADGVRSASGYSPRTGDVSFDSMADISASATTGYSARSVADDWYLKIMMLLKYATKDSQSVMSGTTGYDVQVSPSVATTAKGYVIIKSTDAASLVVGSTVSVGTMTSSGEAKTEKDRSNPWTHDVVDHARVLSIEKYDDANSKVTLDHSAFDASTTGLVSTVPWMTGACDGVEGDGSPTSPTDGKEPFVLQGIEVGHGMLEVSGSMALSSDGKSGWKVMLARDTAAVKKDDASTGFSEVGSLTSTDGDAWVYGLYPSVVGGELLMQHGSGASSSSGICDGIFKNGDGVTGTREWLSLGDLGHWGDAGVWYVGCHDGLGGCWWHIGSRLSATGRGGEAA